MKRLGILMLGGARRVSVGRMIMKAAAEAGYDAELYSYELDRKVPVAEIAEIVEGLRWNDQGLMAHLEETVERLGINIIIPFVDGAIEVASRFCETHKDVFSPVSDAAVSRCMFDKVEADAMFRSAGLPVPSPASVTTGPFPVIAKPRRGSASKGIKVLDSRPVDVDMYGDEYLVQEYIADREEYTVDCYVGCDGRVICAVGRRRLEVIGGEVSRTVTVDDPELTDLSRVVLARTGLRGAVTLQFLRDRADGRLMLMEINPRLGGGVVCSVHAGADIPAMIIAEATGADLEPVGYTPGIEIARYMQEVVFSNEK